MFSMAEDDDLAYRLSRRYADNRRDISWNDDGYRDWANVVYLVWLDSTKPHGVDHIILKDKTPMVGKVRWQVIHCESAEKAERLKTMLLTRFD
jgi:hypothetical protein